MPKDAVRAGLLPEREGNVAKGMIKIQMDKMDTVQSFLHTCAEEIWKELVMLF